MAAMLAAAESSMVTGSSALSLPAWHDQTLHHTTSPMESVNKSEISIQTILLLRLWQAGKSGEVRSRLVQAVTGFFPGTRAELKQQVQDLLALNLADGIGRGQARLVINTAGDEHLRENLNVRLEHRSMPWSRLWKLVLVPAALGHGSGQGGQISRADAFRACLLASHIGLPWRKGLTERQAVNALLKQITGARQGDVHSLRTAVVHGAVKRAVAPDRIRTGEPADPATSPAKQPLQLEKFADAVRELASSCPSGRVGPHKVFISHVWRHARNQGSTAIPGSLDEFKRTLAACLKHNLLHLSRADLAPAFDAAEIAESEIAHMGELFHYILLD